MAFRIDRAPLGKTERTPQGGLRISAFVTRTGVLEYRRADGTIQRELRHPDEVFQSDSLATLEDAPITDLHPGRVTPENHKQLAIGHVRNPAKEDKFVKATAVIQDSSTITAIEKGSRKELSCGYSCDVDMSPGDWEGEKYDGVQRNIRYNHVALGPENWGRAGSSVALHLDAKGDMVEGMKETIDGIEYTVGSPEHISALKKSRSDAIARADASDKLAKDSKAALDAASGARDAAVARADAAEKAIDGRVATRLALLDRARKTLGADWKADGKSDRQVMVDVITKADSTFKLSDDLTDDYLRGRFEAAPVAAATGPGTFRQSVQDAKKPNEGKKSPDQIRKDNSRASANLWKQPLLKSSVKES